MTQTDNTLSFADVVLGQHEHLRIPSRMQWVQKAIDYLVPRVKIWGVCDEDRAAQLTIVLTEVLTNAIVHGNMGISSQLKEQGEAFARELARCSNDPALADKPVDIQVHYDGQTCRWTVTDQGNGFDVDQLLAKLDGDGPDVELLSGRGVMLIRAFVDDVKWSDHGRQIQFSMNRPQAERRRTARRPSRQPMRIAPVQEHGQVDWEKAFNTISLDLSAGGMSVIHPSLERATRLMIEMQTDQGKIYVPAEVCRAQNIDGQTAQIGCRFLSPQSHAQSTFETLDQQARQVEALISQLEEVQGDSAYTSQRQYRRVVFTEPILVDLLDGAEPHRLIARDLSRGGLAAIGPLNVAPQQRVGVLLKIDSPHPVRLQGIVARCYRVAGDQYDLGIQFVTRDE